MDQKQECGICYTPIKHYNLGASICRSCAAFFRRTLNENIHYICRNGNNCAIPGLKPKCKACRFEKCKKLGAHLSTPSVKSSPDSSTTNGNSPSSPTITPTKTPLLQNLLKGYDQVLAGQRILFVTAHPQFGFGEQYIMPKEIRIVEMQTKMLPLWFAMIVDCYGPINNLSHAKSVDVVMNAFHEIGVLNRNYLTSKHFPKMNDNRLMISNGYYALLDLDLWPSFVEETVSIEKQPEIRKMAEKMFQRMLKSSSEFKRLNIRKTDVVVLLLLAIYKNAERLNLMTKETYEFREFIIKEWNIDLRNEYGIDEGNKQMSRIMAYSVECDNHATDLQNSLIVGQLNWPKEGGCCVQQYIEKLTLN